MKIRSSLVSNSSSCSFTVLKKDINLDQFSQIKNWKTEAARYNLRVFDYGGWDIYEVDNSIKFETNMDGFNMLKFLECIGIDQSKIKNFWHINLK